MATGTFVPVEVYLRSSDYEPDAEYVLGEIEQRPIGELNHAAWQDAICAWFRMHAREWNTRTFPELKVQVAADKYRVPDVTVLDHSLSSEQIITHAPIAVFEVLSPQDTVVKLRRKLAEYDAMGIPQIWVVAPETGIFERYESRCLTPSIRFEEGAIAFDLAEIATLLQL